MHEAKPPFYAYAGSRKPNLLLVGEAWGEKEDLLHQPFAGESGKELFRMMGEAWPEAIQWDSYVETQRLLNYGDTWVRPRNLWAQDIRVGMTNVLAFRPPGNKIEHLCVGKKDLPDPDNYPWPAIERALYLKPEYLPEIGRLWAEIETTRPNLIVALGNKACWALCQAINIGSIRGSITSSLPPSEWPYPPIKLLPTYHPAGVLRNWSWRVIVVADLIKAWREAQFSEIKRPKRRVLISPTIEECEAWQSETLAGNYEVLTPDIETAGGQIKCIGFARSPAESLVVPFFDDLWQSYWPDLATEWRAWQVVRVLLESPIPKLFQNGLYDLQYLIRLGFKPRNCLHDTMLLHHSLYPELLKGLGFLGSIYTNEQSWKLMRRKRPDTEKRDD